MNIIVTGRVIRGTEGTDFLAPRDTANTYLALGGSDEIEGGFGGDSIYGGEGFDFATYKTSDAAVTVDLRETEQHGGDAEGDNLYSIEGVIGSDFDDRLTGTDTRNQLIGGKGLDVLDGRLDNDFFDGGIDGKDDVIIGGLGTDMVSYFFATEDMTITLQTDNGRFGSGVVNAQLIPIQIAGHDGFLRRPAIKEDTLLSIEDVRAGMGNDTIFGNAQANRLEGNQGNDRIDGAAGSDLVLGGAGDDTLIGGSGSDTLTGSIGDDTFLFRTGDSSAFNTDVITDFEHGIDRLDVSGIDANASLAGNQAFRFVSGGLTGSAGQLSVVLTQVSPDVGASFFTVSGDMDGDRRADFRIRVEMPSGLDLDRSDFLL